MSDRARSFSPRLTLSEYDLTVMRVWFEDAFERPPKTPAEMVGAFAFNAVVDKIMREGDARNI